MFFNICWSTCSGASISLAQGQHDFYHILSILNKDNGIKIKSNLTVCPLFRHKSLLSFTVSWKSLNSRVTISLNNTKHRGKKNRFICLECQLTLDTDLDFKKWQHTLPLSVSTESVFELSRPHPVTAGIDFSQLWPREGLSV